MDFGRASESSGGIGPSGCELRANAPAAVVSNFARDSLPHATISAMLPVRNMSLMLACLTRCMPPCMKGMSSCRGSKKQWGAIAPYSEHPHPTCSPCCSSPTRLWEFLQDGADRPHRCRADAAYEQTVFLYMKQKPRKRVNAYGAMV